MSSVSKHNKKSYSPVYKIYRRFRFLRFKKRLLLKTQQEIRRLKDLERKQQRDELKEFRLSEKQKRRIKEKEDLKESRKIKKELKDEFRHLKIQSELEQKQISAVEKEKARVSRFQEKRDRKRLLRQYLKLQRQGVVQTVRSINVATVRKKIRNFRESAPKRKLFALISFNSTILFLLSYFSLFYISQAVTVIAASFFKYPTIVYYYEVYFNIGAEAWYHDSVKTIFSAGPLMIFVIGIVFLIIYHNAREATGPFKLFFLWGFLQAVNMLFGALLVGTLFEAGVGYVISWMYIMDTGKVLFSIVSIFFLVIAGLIATKEFLISGNTYHCEINQANRTSFIFAQVLMPYLAGNIILVLLRQPRFVFYETFTGITLFISLLAVLATYKSFNDLYFEEEEKKPGIVWKPAAVLFGLILIFRIVLGFGIRFGG
jgi:hypothetical protein